MSNSFSYIVYLGLFGPTVIFVKFLIPTHHSFLSFTKDDGITMFSINVKANASFSIILSSEFDGISNCFNLLQYANPPSQIYVTLDGIVIQKMLFFQLLEELNCLKIQLFEDFYIQKNQMVQ